MEVVEAANGDEAVEILEKEKFDIIVSDVHMPGMNGMELIKVIRSMKQHRFVPIIMVTTENKKEFLNEARESGASGWIVKPFSVDKFKQIVKRFVG